MSQQSLSMSAWLCIEEQQPGFSFWKELETNTTNTCRTLTAHFPRPKQTSSQVSCLRVTSQAIKRRYQALLVTCWPPSPSERVKNTFPYPDLLVPGEAHHIIQLGVQFWMTLIQITCYRIQKQGGEWSDYDVGLRSRAQVPWALAARQFQSLQMSWTLSCSCCLPQNTELN